MPEDRNDSLPSGYAELLEELKTRIHAAQTRAAVSVNRELVLLYWSIGREILARQLQEGWGAKVIDRLSSDLRREFPEMSGLSTRNLKYMRTLAETYPDREIVQQAVAQLPWGHNVRLLDAVKIPEEREFYLRQAIRHGWSRSVLVHQIESRLYERQGKAMTNFDQTLPVPQSDLAREILKDPYNFDFLTLGPEAQTGSPPCRRPFLVPEGRHRIARDFNPSRRCGELEPPRRPRPREGLKPLAILYRPKGRRRTTSGKPNLRFFLDACLTVAVYRAWHPGSARSARFSPGRPDG